MEKKLLNQYKSTFHFGASVKYDKILNRGYGKEEIPPGLSIAIIVKKEWKQKMVSTRTGVVVGWRWLSNGIGEYGSCDGNCYTATQSIFAIEVKRGMMNKMDLVLPESLSIHIKFYDSSKPIPKSTAWPKIPDRTSIFNDHDKQLLRDCMKSVPRDSRGRWK